MVNNIKSLKQSLHVTEAQLNSLNFKQPKARMLLYRAQIKLGNIFKDIDDAEKMENNKK